MLVISRKREGSAQEADADEQTRIDFRGGQAAGHDHHEHQHEARGRKRQAGAFGGVAQAALQKLGDQNRGSEQDHAQNERERNRGSEIAVLEQTHVDDGIGVIPLPEEECGEHRNADAGQRA